MNSALIDRSSLLARKTNMAGGEFEKDIVSKSIEYAAGRLKLSNIKNLQTKAIRSALKGEDVFVNLPTGYGKSAIFQAIPLCKDFVRTATVAASAASTQIPSAFPGETGQTSAGGTTRSRAALSIEVIHYTQGRRKN